jgi:hypothetical protein
VAVGVLDGVAVSVGVGVSCEAGTGAASVTRPASTLGGVGGGAETVARLEAAGIVSMTGSALGAPENA